MSRMAHKSGICGSASMLCSTPLILICGKGILRRKFRMPTERRVSILQRMEIGDHVLSIAFAGEIDEHFCPVNVPCGVPEKLVELGVVPGDVRVLHRGGKIESGNRAALAADNAGQRRPDLVHAGFRRMASRTSAVKKGLSR